MRSATAMVPATGRPMSTAVRSTAATGRLGGKGGSQHDRGCCNEGWQESRHGGFLFMERYGAGLYRLEQAYNVTDQPNGPSQNAAQPI